MCNMIEIALGLLTCFFPENTGVMGRQGVLWPYPLLCLTDGRTLLGDPFPLNLEGLARKQGKSYLSE